MGKVQRVWDEFSSETTTHGIGRVVGSQRRCWARGFWLLVFLFGSAFFTFQTHQLVTKYYEYPTNVQTTLHFAALPFPAITICNQNPIRAIDQLKDRPMYGPLKMDAMFRSHLKKAAYGFGWTLDEDGNLIGEYELSYSQAEDSAGEENWLPDEPLPPLSGETDADAEALLDDIDDDALLPDMTDPSTTDVPLRRKRNADGEVVKLGKTGSVNTRLSAMQLTAKAASDMKYIIEEAKRSNATEYAIYQNAMTDIDSFIKDCSINTKKCDLNEQFTAVESSLHGRCFTFNPFDPKTKKQIKIIRAGAAFGLRMVIFVDQLMSVATTDVAGVKIVVHNPGEHPFPETVGHNAQVNMRTSVGLKMLKTKRLPPPHGECIDNSGEKSHVDHELDYFYPGKYTVQGCTMSCTAAFLALACNCTPPTYPRAPLNHTVTVAVFDDPAEDIKVLGSQVPVCTIKEKLCAEIAELEYLTPATDEEEEEELARTCGCFPPCHDTHYEATLSTSSIAETSTRNQREVPCNESKFEAALWLDPINYNTGNMSFDLRHADTDNSDNFGESDFHGELEDAECGANETIEVDRGYEQAEIEIFYEQLSFRFFQEVEAYNSVQLISDLGGQLGLWLGMSILSLAEFLSLIMSLIGAMCHCSKGDIEKKSSHIHPSSSDVRKYSSGMHLPPVPVQ